MDVFHRLPSELFFEIALHLPLTNDVLAFSLTTTRVRGALSTPALFKARLSLRGWDVSAWEDEDDIAQSPGDLMRWTCIDYTYCWIIQLFEEAAVDGYFPVTPNRPTRPESPDPGQGNPSPNLRPVFGGLGNKTAIWLEKLSKVLPLFVTHHRGGNISRITEAKYRYVLRAYTRSLGDLGILVKSVHPLNTSKNPFPRVAPSDYCWFERICFSLIALLIQCDATTVVSIFTDTSGGLRAPELLPTALEWPLNEHLPILQSTLIPESNYEPYFDAFLFQSILLLKLHVEATRPSMPQPPGRALLTPLLPHFDPRSSPSYSYYSYFLDGSPVEPGTPTIAAPSGVPLSLPSPSPPSPVRPWLRDGLAGTPLAGLSSMTSSAWVGYYTYNHGEDRRDPPMYLELRSRPLLSSSDAKSHLLGFLGKGHDGIGPFTISGWCNAHTGEVNAIKAYEMVQWKWCGVLTPFGMVGIWAPEWCGGRWWIWPREWSPID